MTLLFTQKQMDDLQTEIRRVIAEDDRDVSECCKCGLSELTNSGIDHRRSAAPAGQATTPGPGWRSPASD